MKKILLFSLIIVSCNVAFAFQTTIPVIIPEPVSMKLQPGEFVLSEDLIITYNNEELSAIADHTADMLMVTHWLRFPRIQQPQVPQESPFLHLEMVVSDEYTHNEAYNLEITENGIHIKSSSTSGIFHGIQTLRQLLPVEIELGDPSLVPRNMTWTLPQLLIEDHPRFDYRGMHLDVARHFMPVEFVKKFLDLMALFKFNHFHWHLTEDQGWRIEIKQYPRLTEIGAWRDSTLIGNYGSGKYDNVRHGGFYTQDEIREVVAYASARGITVIPEIEMPGHASAALAAYPELGCVDKQYHVQSTWGVFEDIFCPSEETFLFLENVLTEVVALFPGPYVHVGGDEAPKKQWEESELAQQVMVREGLENEEELQSYFIRRIQRFLDTKDKQLIGWDEIMEGGLAPNAIVMSWRGVQGGIDAAKNGHQVIMTPNGTNYFDHYQYQRESEPVAIGGFTPLRDVYLYEPIPAALSGDAADNVLGAQANIWTEYMHTGKKVEYMAFPRTIALSEVLWSPVELRNWDVFEDKLQVVLERMEVMGVTYGE